MKLSSMSPPALIYQTEKWAQGLCLHIPRNICELWWLEKTSWMKSNFKDLGLAVWDFYGEISELDFHKKGITCAVWEH